MIIDHSLRLVFLHVPKCAGTALRTAWQDAAEGRDVVSWFDFEFDPVLQRQVDLAHQPLMDLRHRKEWRFLRRYHVVACIRHPYQRLASACREYYRQQSRESELQMRREPPSREQLLSYLRRLPGAMDAHDLRYVHGFPISWFSHYGTQPMVDTLLRCGQLADDLNTQHTAATAGCSNRPTEAGGHGGATPTLSSTGPTRAGSGPAGPGPRAASG